MDWLPPCAPAPAPVTSSSVCNGLSLNPDEVVLEEGEFLGDSSSNSNQKVAAKNMEKKSMPWYIWLVLGLGLAVILYWLINMIRRARSRRVNVPTVAAAVLPVPPVHVATPPPPASLPVSQAPVHLPPVPPPVTGGTALPMPMPMPNAANGLPTADAVVVIKYYRVQSPSDPLDSLWQALHEKLQFDRRILMVTVPNDKSQSAFMTIATTNRPNTEARLPINEAPNRLAQQIQDYVASLSENHAKPSFQPALLGCGAEEDDKRFKPVQGPQLVLRTPPSSSRGANPF